MAELEATCQIDRFTELVGKDGKRRPRELAKYKIMPDMTAEEYEGLKASIAAHGVMVPIELDETGAVLDGHQRLRACEELGITQYATIIRAGMSEDEKIEHILALNLLRGHDSVIVRREEGNVDDIIIERDYPRRDVGDLSNLKDSIARVGLLKAIVVNEELVLVAGFRRLEAVRALGWTRVDATVVCAPSRDDRLNMYSHEHGQQKGYTPSETVAATQRPSEPG